MSRDVGCCRRKEIDTFVLVLNCFAGSTGAQSAKAAEVLLWFRRQSPIEGAAGAQDLLLLMVDARQRPKMRLSAPSHTSLGNDGSIFFEWPEEYPFPSAHARLLGVDGTSWLTPTRCWTS